MLWPFSNIVEKSWIADRWPTGQSSWRVAAHPRRGPADRRQHREAAFSPGAGPSAGQVSRRQRRAATALSLPHAPSRTRDPPRTSSSHRRAGRGQAQVSSRMARLNRSWIVTASRSLTKRGTVVWGQLVEQGLSLLQIERVEALGEPAVDRCEQIASLIPLALITPEPRHAHCCA